VDEFIRQLAGPLGGIAALGFGVGAMSGYAFALKSVTANKIDAIVKPLEVKVKVLQEQLETLQEELSKEREFRAKLFAKVLNQEVE
jgi:hypothetical protein